MIEINSFTTQQALKRFNELLEYICKNFDDNSPLSYSFQVGDVDVITKCLTEYDNLVWEIGYLRKKIDVLKEDLQEYKDAYEGMIKRKNEEELESGKDNF